MWQRDDKSENANVVAVFENEDDGDEAILQLRLSGFRDRHIGYFSWTPTGVMANLMDRNYWLVGATLGTIVGAAIGVGIALFLSRAGISFTGGLDPFGLMMTSLVFGALFGSFAGGVIGWNISRRGVAPPAVGSTVGPYVLAVAAGNAQNRAWAAIRHCGGHEMLPEVLPHTPGMPAAINGIA